MVSGGTGEIDKKGEPYCKAVYAVAERYLKHMSPEQREDMRKLFNSWKNAPDKLDVSFMYKLSGWRAVYTLNLFRSRIQTVWFSLKQLLSDQSGIGPQLAEILNRTQRIVSIGCGPGPCIASILIALRDYVGFTKYVKLIGIDQFIGWGPYVTSMNSVEEAGASSVEFWHERVEEATIDSLPNADVAIMSYTDAAIHTPKFWETMRMKFAFILVLDQRKGALSRELQRQGFGHFEYEFKGSKRVFYYINPFGEFLKLAHGAGGSGGGGARDGPSGRVGGERGEGDSDYDEDDNSSIFDSNDSDDSSSTCSSSSSLSTDSDYSASLQDDANVAREVQQLVTFLLDKTEESLLLGLDDSVRPHAVTPEEIALAAAVVRRAEAHDRTVDKRRVIENTIDVSLELEAIITKELVAAVESMNAAAASAESGGSKAKRKKERQSKRSRQSKPAELDELTAVLRPDETGEEINDATLTAQSPTTSPKLKKLPTLTTQNRPAPSTFVSVPITQIAELPQVRRMEQELGLPAVPKRRVENLNLSRNRHRAHLLNKSQQDQLVKALLLDIGEDPDDVTVAAAAKVRNGDSGSSSSSDEEEENVTELCDADVEEKYFPKASPAGSAVASTVPAAVVSSPVASSAAATSAVAMPLKSIASTPSRQPVGGAVGQPVKLAGGGGERVLSVKMPEWAQSLIHNWAGDSSTASGTLGASRREGAGNKSACVINLTGGGGPLMPIGAAATRPSVPAGNVPPNQQQQQQQQQQQWPGTVPTNLQQQNRPVAQSMPAQAAYSSRPGGPIGSGYQQHPGQPMPSPAGSMPPPLPLPQSATFVQGYGQQATHMPTTQVGVSGYVGPQQPAAQKPSLASRRMTEDERILEEETQKFLERMGVLKSSTDANKDRDRDSNQRGRDRRNLPDRERFRHRPVAFGRRRSPSPRSLSSSSRRRSPPRSPRSPPRSPSNSPPPQSQRLAPRSPPCRSPRSPKRRRQSERQQEQPPATTPTSPQPPPAPQPQASPSLGRQSSMASVVSSVSKRRADANSSGGGGDDGGSGKLQRLSDKDKDKIKEKPLKERHQQKEKEKLKQQDKEKPVDKNVHSRRDEKKKKKRRSSNDKKPSHRHHKRRRSASSGSSSASGGVGGGGGERSNYDVSRLSPGPRALEDLEFVSEDSDLEQLNYAHQVAAEAAAKKQQQQQQVPNGSGDKKRIKLKR